MGQHKTGKWIVLSSLVSGDQACICPICLKTRDFFNYYSCIKQEAELYSRNSEVLA